MKIVIYAVPAILAAVLMAGQFDARGNSVDREDAAGQRESPDDPAPNQLALAPEPESQSIDQQGPTLATEPRPEQTLAPQGEPREAAGEWQVVRQRRPDVEREPAHARRAADPDQLAREQEAQRDALLQQQAQQLEDLLERQRREFEELLEQQAGTAAARPGDEQPIESLTQTERDEFLGQQPLDQDRDEQLFSGYDNRPLDPYPDAGFDQGEQPLEPYPDDGRRYERDRRETLEILLPRGRRFQFRLW